MNMLLDQLEIALNSDDVRKILADDKKVIMIGVENAYPMGLDPTNIRKYWEKGARYVSFLIMDIVNFPTQILENLITLLFIMV